MSNKTHYRNVDIRLATLDRIEKSQRMNKLKELADECEKQEDELVALQAEKQAWEFDKYKLDMLQWQIQHWERELRVHPLSVFEIEKEMKEVVERLQTSMSN